MRAAKAALRALGFAGGDPARGEAGALMAFGEGRETLLEAGPPLIGEAVGRAMRGMTLAAAWCVLIAQHGPSRPQTADSVEQIA